MNKKYNWLLYLLPIAVGGFFVWRLTRKPKGELPSSGTGGSGSGGSEKPKADDKYPLKNGSSGNNVVRLQKAILDYDLTKLPKFGYDGSFGSETESALLSIMKKKSATESDVMGLEQLALKNGTNGQWKNWKKTA